MNSNENQPDYYKLGSGSGIPPDIYSSFMDDIQCTAPGQGSVLGISSGLGRRRRRPKYHIRPPPPPRKIKKRKRTLRKKKSKGSGKGAGLYDDMGAGLDSESDSESDIATGKGVYEDETSGPLTSAPCSDAYMHDSNMRKIKQQFVNSHKMYLERSTRMRKYQCNILFEVFVEWSKDKKMSNTVGEKNIVEKFFDHVLQEDSKRNPLINIPYHRI